jgi:hypothetical protein
MAQGNTKGLKAKPTSGGRKKGGTMQKGKRDIAPKSTHKIAERRQKQVSLGTTVFSPKCRSPFLRVQREGTGNATDDAYTMLTAATLEQNQRLDREADGPGCQRREAYHHEEQGRS